MQKASHFTIFVATGKVKQSEKGINHFFLIKKPFSNQTKS